MSGNHLIERLKKVLPLNSDVLEIGSGPGTDWRILNSSYNVTGSDNSKEFLDYLISKNPEGDFLELDAVTLATDTKCDGIYSNKVLHHLSDAELIESIKRQTEILEPQGIICHSFWRGQGSEIFKGLFVNYHSELELKVLFEDYFDTLLLERYQEFDDGDSLLLIARQKRNGMLIETRFF